MFLALLLKLIGSKDPDALKIPARRAEYSLTESASSPVQAEPLHEDDAVVKWDDDGRMRLHQPSQLEHPDMAPEPKNGEGEKSGLRFRPKPPLSTTPTMHISTMQPEVGC